MERVYKIGGCDGGMRSVLFPVSSVAVLHLDVSCIDVSFDATVPTYANLYKGKFHPHPKTLRRRHRLPPQAKAHKPLEILEDFPFRCPIPRWRIGASDRRGRAGRRREGG